MRRFATCFFAFVLCAPSAFGATASRVLPSDKVNSENVQSQNNTTRSTISRTASRTATVGTTETDTPAPKTVARTASRGAATRKAVSQTADKLDAAVNTVGRNARVSAASINNNPTLRRAGVVLRPSTAEVGGRATIAGTDVQTGSNIDESLRGVQSRAATRESISEAKERLEQTAELNKSCQEQYNDCMDQFCAVIDANQGRCSCSSNLTKYTKVEEAVKAANAELNSVAQRIRYVGLSADEIRAILTETEAEAALSGQKDTTETRNMLAEIEDLIKDPTSNSASYSESSFGLDLNLDFSSNSADMFSLDFLNLDSNSSFSNLRGTDLYNAARNRCSTILNQCKGAGGTPKQITGNYDLAIDKDCIAYEKGLKKMNETLVSNVRSAELMLQKARLAVLQNKNQYDAKGCIAALDSCMRDDMVCGDDYYKCVDPTKRYIDENGEVVLGQNITLITEFMENYNNAKINDEFMTAAMNVEIDPDVCSAEDGNNGVCVASYLLGKIGTGAKATDGGLCRAVLDKCQYYTYKENQYVWNNDIVENYIQRAMVNIRAAQQSIISDYASNCMVDVATCYNNQVTQVNTWSSSASINSIYDVMRGACRNVALTCGYAIFAGPPALDPNDGKPTAGCPDAANATDEAQRNNEYVNCISEMFFESLLCPANSEYIKSASGKTADGFVNAVCKCLDGYEPVGKQCMKACDTTANFSGKRDAYNNCLCAGGYKLSGGQCIADSAE
ncbi:MAG: hypothetical protein IKB05_01705 [Alphaproteobacteria bacterium]|nr:hypothetical protein [Alphaproteobacteria bacterium]